MPVLAEQTIEGASLIKDSQVLIPVLSLWAIGKIWVPHSCTARANPISYAVGRQGVIIPTDIGSICTDTLQLTFLISAQPAVARPALRNMAFIDTQLTGYSLLVLRWSTGKGKGSP